MLLKNLKFFSLTADLILVQDSILRQAMSKRKDGRILQFKRRGARKQIITSYCFDEDETIKRLLPQKLKDQYAFKSEKALKALILSEVVER